MTKETFDKAAALNLRIEMLSAMKRNVENTGSVKVLFHPQLQEAFPEEIETMKDFMLSYFEDQINEAQKEFDTI